MGKSRKRERVVSAPVFLSALNHTDRIGTHFSSDLTAFGISCITYSVMKNKQTPLPAGSAEQPAAHAETGQTGNSAVERLMGWLEWVRKEGRDGPSPSHAATVLGCTRSMVGALVRRGILERAVYAEDGYDIVVISQRSIDRAVTSKKQTGCWTTPAAVTWRQVPLTKSQKRMLGGGMRFRQVATPWRKKLIALGKLEHFEVTLSTDEKLAFINQTSPDGGNFTHETEVFCLHCGRVYRAYEAKIVQPAPQNVPPGTPPKKPWILCKYWPVCNGTVIDWMPQDMDGNRMRGWDKHWKEHDDWEQSEEGQKAIQKSARWLAKTGQRKKTKDHGK